MPTRNPLRSWKIIVKSARETRSTDSWGDPISYRGTESHYVVARTKKNAIYQAKRMAGYVADAHTSGGVKNVVILANLEEE